MKVISFLGNSSTIAIIGLIIVFAIVEKQNVFGLYIEGVKSGGKLILELFPTLLGLFVAVRNAE